MKILAMERELPGATAERFQAHARAEAARVWELQQSGVIREAYFHRDAHVAVLMLECRDVDEAAAALATLPLVRERLIAFDLVPLVPYSGFARLFASS